MKKTVLLTLLMTMMLTLSAQTTNFRSIALQGVSLKVNGGYTVPQLVNIVNDTTTVLFVKFYDQIVQPFSTSKPVLTIMVPASSTVTLNTSKIMHFTNAVWIRAGKGVLDADTTWNKWKTFPPIVEITY